MTSAAYAAICHRHAGESTEQKTRRRIPGPKRGRCRSASLGTMAFAASAPANVPRFHGTFPRHGGSPSRWRRRSLARAVSSSGPSGPITAATAAMARSGPRYRDCPGICPWMVSPFDADGPCPAWHHHPEDWQRAVGTYDGMLYSDPVAPLSNLQFLRNRIQKEARDLN